MLENPQAQAATNGAGAGGEPIGSLRGGALMVEVEISSGLLEIEMRQPAGIGGRSSYLVGVIAAPIARGDFVGRHFNASEAVLDTDQCLALEEEINDAITELIEEIAPAAGALGTQGLPAAVFEDGASASPT